MLQVGYTNGDQTGTLSFPSHDVSTDSSGRTRNPWGIDPSDNARYDPQDLNKWLSTNVGLYQSRMFGTHWCGPGGGGPVVNADDAACRAHDACDAAAGVSAAQNTGGATPTAAQASAMASCNQSMHNAVSARPELFPTSFLQFWLTGGAGHIYKGTEAKPQKRTPQPQIHAWP